MRKNAVEMNRTRSDDGAQTCRRCGTCCKKGGPALHHEDRELVESGRIPLADLYTIRRGEIVRDNVRGELQPLKEEIIKIKARRSGSRTCLYYVECDQSCRIYAFRPLECRTLQCWDTREIERIYSIGRLRRKDLLAEVDGLWELIEDHSRRCSFEKINRWSRQLKKDESRKNFEKVLEVIQFDAELRKLVIERGDIGPAMLDFLFGRPLTESVRQFGIRLESEGGKITRLVIQR